MGEMRLPAAAPAPICAERSMNLRRVRLESANDLLPMKKTFWDRPGLNTCASPMVRRRGRFANRIPAAAVPGIRIGWHDRRAIASAATLNVVKPDGKGFHKLQLYLLRPGQPALDGPLPGVRGVEHPGGGKGRRSPGRSTGRFEGRPRQSAVPPRRGLCRA